jgi:hypothetical protein
MGTLVLVWINLTQGILVFMDYGLKKDAAMANLFGSRCLENVLEN